MQKIRVECVKWQFVARLVGDTVGRLNSSIVWRGAQSRTWLHIPFPDLSVFPFPCVCGPSGSSQPTWHQSSVFALLPSLYQEQFWFQKSYACLFQVLEAKYIWKQDTEENIWAQEAVEWGVENAPQWGTYTILSWYGNTTTLLFSLRGLEILLQERRGQVKTIVMEHCNDILFHKYGPANKQHTNHCICFDGVLIGAQCTATF